MKLRIGITQRVEVVAAYHERRDCIDQSWCAFVEGMDLYPVLLPNSLKDIEGYLQEAGLDGVLLTGGNDLCLLPDAKNTALERDCFEQKVLDFAKKDKIPVLGVCRGMQLINCYQDGSLSKVTGHIGCRHRVYRVSDVDSVLPETMDVNSYHSWGIAKSDLGKDLQSIQIDDDNNIEAFRHKLLPWFGIMWHPERELPKNQNDMRFIKNIFGA